MTAAWKEWIEAYPTIRNLEADLKLDQASPSTLRVYIVAVKKFVDYLDVETPEAAMEKTRGEPEPHINRFLRRVVADGLSTKYASQLSSGVQKWFRANEVRLDRDSLRTPSARPVTQDRLPDVETLRAFMKHADIRGRFLLTGMVSSGLRMGGILGLKMKDLDLDLDPEIIVVYVPHRAAKGYMNSETPDKILYHTFMSGEAQEALEDYLDHRRRILGETITPESPMITWRYSDNVGRHLHYNTANTIWHNILKKAGETERSRNWHVYHSHVLRKFFRTNCAYARVQNEIVHKWMGHVGYLEREYLRLSAERDLLLYREAEPYLTISETAELRREIDGRLSEQAVKIQELERQLAARDNQLERFEKLATFLERKLGREEGNGDSNNPGMFG